MLWVWVFVVVFADSSTKTLPTTKLSADAAYSDSSDLSLAERVIEKQEQETVERNRRYIYTRLLVSTLNMRERLFSKIECALIDRHRGVLSVHFERQMFLQYNISVNPFCGVLQMSIK